MITKQQIADLRPGDVVELHRQGWATDVVVRGTLRGDSCAGELYIGDYAIWSESGNEPDWLAFPGTTLAVVSRAPRPLYVNHDRTEPVPGDVVRASDGTSSVAFRTVGQWIWPNGTRAIPGDPPFRLLVDGATGMPVRTT